MQVEKSAGTFCQAKQSSKAEKLTEPEPVLIIIIRNVSPFPSWPRGQAVFLISFLFTLFVPLFPISGLVCTLPLLPSSSVSHFIMAASAPAEPRVKPTKPDEEAYKANLAQAEKEHAAAQEKLVR